MTKISQTTSNKIANLSFVCACFVVALHTFPSVEVGSFLWHIAAIISYGVGRIAVPFFCIVSGFMVARHIEEKNWYRNALKKRITTIIVPFVLWNVAWLVVEHRLDLLAIFGELDGMTNPFYHPPLGPTWYLRSLLVFVFISPILCWFVKEHALFTLIVVFVAYVFLFVPDNETFALLTSVFHLEALFYYIVGLLIAIRNINFDFNRNRMYLILGLAVSIIGTALRIEAVKEGWYIYYPLRAFVVPGFLLFAWTLIPSIKWSSFICRSTFPIYLLHMFAFILIYKVIGSCDSAFKYAIYIGGGGNSSYGNYLCFTKMCASYCRRSFWWEVNYG